MTDGWTARGRAWLRDGAPVGDAFIGWSKASVPMSAGMARTTLKVTVTGIKRARVRLWLGVRLIRFSAWVIGCGVEVGIAPTKPDADKPDWHRTLPALRETYPSQGTPRSKV